MKYVLARNDSGAWGSDPTGGADSVVLRSTDIALDGGWSLGDPARRALSIAERRATQLVVGDLVVVKASGSPAHLGKTALVTEDVAALAPCFSNFVQRLRPLPGTDPKYLWHFMNSAAAAIQVEMLGTTTTGLRNLSGGLIGSLVFPGPPSQVQRRIADFLDSETARIDALIEKKKRMIALLDLRVIRAAFDMITGQFESGQRKPSGVPWLGDVPIAWDVAPLGSRYTVQLGRMLNAERAASGDLRPYLRNMNVRWDSFDLTDIAEMDFPPEERRRYTLVAGDLLVCEGGAGVGRAAVWDGSLHGCHFQKSLHRVRATGPWPVGWVLEWLRVSKSLSAFAVEGNLATIPHLTAEQLRAHRIPFPAPGRANMLLSSFGSFGSPSKLRRRSWLTRSTS